MLFQNVALASAMAATAIASVSAGTPLESCVGPKCVTTTNAEKYEAFAAHRARKIAHLHQQDRKATEYLYDVDGSVTKSFEERKGYTKCVQGQANGFGCRNVDMYAHITLEELQDGSEAGITQGYDLWGWEDDVTNQDWIFVTLNGGTVFVDITDPENPVPRAYMPYGPQNQGVRDVKTYKHYMYSLHDTSAGDENHIQIYDLHQLRDLPEGYQTLEPTSVYDGVATNAHNVIIEEETATMLLAYSIQIDADPEQVGFQTVSLEDPLNPTFQAHVPQVGLTHDAHCVVYHGPDSEFEGRTICATFNINSCSFFDITDLANPELLSVFTYPGITGSHQGWMTDDHQYMVHNDELDGPYATPGNDGNTGDPTATQTGTRVFIWDIRLLRAPLLIGFEDSIDNHNDHNMHIRNDQLAFHAQYQHGLAVLDVSKIETGRTPEVASFDCYPPAVNQATAHIDTDGAWTAYPYNTKGVVAVSCTNNGLFLLKVQDHVIPDAPKREIAPRPADAPRPRINEPLEEPRHKRFPASCKGYCANSIFAQAPNGCYCGPDCLTGGIGGNCCPDYAEVCAPGAAEFLGELNETVFAQSGAAASPESSYSTSQVAGIAAGSVVAGAAVTALGAWAVARQLNQKREHAANVDQIQNSV